MRSDTGSLRTYFPGNDTDLLEKCKVVLQVPVIGDLSVVHAQDVGDDEVDRLALASMTDCP
jgi:hypothetical protein